MFLSPQPKSSSGAESPTTARPLEMDDDDVQESGIVSGEGDAAAAATPNPPPGEEEAPPPKPPRPLSPQQQAENTLKEAFPSIDVAVVKAVLIASGGRVEPAFNALLGTAPVCLCTTPINYGYRHVRSRCCARAYSSATTSSSSSSSAIWVYPANPTRGRRTICQTTRRAL